MLKRFLDRRLAPLALLLAAVVGAAAIYGAVRIASSDDDDPVAAAPPGACTPAPTTFGTPPDSFTYDKVDERTRANTVKALQLDEAGGAVEMVRVARGGLALGELVGVPHPTDPTQLASSMVAAAERGGAQVTRAAGYVLIPLRDGRRIGVGVRGCDTILISAQDPNAVQFLAANVFSGS